MEIDITLTPEVPIPNFTTYRDGGSCGFKLDDKNFMLNNGMHSRVTQFGSPLINDLQGTRKVTAEEADRLRTVLPAWISHIDANRTNMSQYQSQHYTILKACLQRVQSFDNTYVDGFATA